MQKPIRAGRHILTDFLFEGEGEGRDEISQAHKTKRANLIRNAVPIVDELKEISEEYSKVVSKKGVQYGLTAGGVISMTRGKSKTPGGVCACLVPGQDTTICECMQIAL